MGLNSNYEELVINHKTIINNIRQEINIEASDNRLHELKSIIEHNIKDFILTSSFLAQKQKSGAVFNILNTLIENIISDYNTLGIEIFELIVGAKPQKQTEQSSYITSIDDVVLEKGKVIKDRLAPLIKGCKGKRLALIVYVLYTKEYIRIPDKPNGGLKALFDVLKKDYGATGTATGLRDCLKIATVIEGGCPFTRTEDIKNIEDIKKALK